MLKIALPKSNEFTRRSIEILRKAGIDFSQNADEFGVFYSQDFPAQIRIMEFDQIISAVASGGQDIGIVGKHHFENSEAQINCVHTFSSYKRNFSLLVNKSMKYRGLESMTGRKIATAFPNLVSKFFKSKNIRIEIFTFQVPLSLSVDLGIADGSCALTDENILNFYSQMREVEVIMQSCPVIISGKELPAARQIILDELIDRVISVQNAEGKKMIYVPVPIDKKEHVLQVLELHNYKMIEMTTNSGDYAVIHILADEKNLWDLKTHLKSLGAEDIFVMPIDKII